MKTRKFLNTFIITVCVIFHLWTISSYIEVVSKNRTENPVYSDLNAFEVLFNEV